MSALPEDLRTTTSIDPEGIPFARLERDWGTTYMKLLRCSVEENSFTNIIRYPAGVTLATHLHTGPVEVYTFEGKWRYLEYDWVATAGSYAHEPAGTVHTLRIEEETLALFIVNGGFVYFEPDTASATCGSRTCPSRCPARARSRWRWPSTVCAAPTSTSSTTARERCRSCPTLSPGRAPR
jgi:hypothetical protein